MQGFDFTANTANNARAFLAGMNYERYKREQLEAQYKAQDCIKDVITIGSLGVIAGCFAGYISNEMGL